MSNQEGFLAALEMTGVEDGAEGHPAGLEKTKLEIRNSEIQNASRNDGKEYATLSKGKTERAGHPREKKIKIVSAG